MTSDRKCEARTRSMLSSWDLKQIKEAVRELRAASPRSVLADLVEEKIRAMENDDPMPRPDVPESAARWSIN